MCLICIEVIKHRMTLTEAEGAAMEWINTDTVPEGEENHVYRLFEALRDADIEELAEVLDENGDD